MDKAHKATDQEIYKLERRIKKIYREASKEAEQTIKEYFAQFEKRDAEMRELVKAGEVSEDNYQQWRLNQMSRGYRYEAMRSNLAERYTNANEVAISYVNDDMAKIYSLNRSYSIQYAKGASRYLRNVNLTLYDENTVKRLLRDSPNFLPHYPKQKAIDRGIDLTYGKRQIAASLRSGILQGKSIGKIAADLRKRITTMDQTSAIRAARTAMTEAENAGRQDGAEYLESLGCVVQKRWIATDDDRTREAHWEADGQEVDQDQPFEVGGELLMYPGDTSCGASGANLYNCRCSLGTFVTGFKSILPEEKQGAVEVL